MEDEDGEWGLHEAAARECLGDEMREERGESLKDFSYETPL
jgi:hypothetical protein